MENPLFSRLFDQIYELEDFATEVLGGVLRSDQALLDSFVNKVLGIKGDHFCVETQTIYHDLTIDMVFYNEPSLCFLENKVDAFMKEQMAHLEKCEAILLAEQHDSRDVYLRYCSKYYDTQPIKGINFAQFRWADVCVFLEDYTHNPLVGAFLDFIKEKEMRGITELNTNDLLAMSALHDTLSKMDECLDSIAAEFTMLFGYPTMGRPKETLERLKLLVQLNSYRMMKQDILLGEGGWSEITVCFDYERLTSHSTTLAVWYWCDRSHSQYESLKELFRQHKHIFAIHPGFLFEERPIGLRIIIQKPLTDFDTEPHQLQGIHDWFVETLWVFRKFADKTPQLNWNLPT